MSASLPPNLPNAQPRPPLTRDGLPGFFAPVLKSVLLLCIVCIPLYAGLALVSVPLQEAAWLQQLLSDPDVHWVPPSLRWLLENAMLTNVILCVWSVIATGVTWALLKRWKWALWPFNVLLVLSAVSNFVIAWGVDDIFRHLLAQLPADAADYRQLRTDLQVQRILFGGMLVLTAFAFAGLQGWFAFRLCAADVRRALR